MSTPFSKLLGTRILLNKPEKPESKIQLSAEAEAELEREMMSKWTRLEVYATGREVTEVSVGDRVFVPAQYLHHAEVVHLEDGQIKLMIAERDVALVW
jgi:hypothetical protein